MAGLPCAKQIIDTGSDTSGLVLCVVTTVAMYEAQGIDPPQAMADAWQEATARLETIGSEILAHLDQLNPKT